MAILQVEDIQKRFGRTRVLEDISFSLEQGQAMAIIGSSGSGKTTLLRCLNFLEQPDRGRITVGGEVLFDADDPATQRESEVRKKRLHFGLVFQSFNLFPQYTALQNVTLASQLLAKERPDFKQNKKQIFAQIEEEGRELLELVSQSFPERSGAMPVLLAFVLCLLSAMNDTTAPSVSLEGKQLWLAQSLPVSPWQVLRAKLRLQLLITVPPMLLCLVCLLAVYPGSPLELLFIAVTALSYALLMALLGLFLGLKMPNLSWTNEVVPIKQSACVALSLFGGWAVAMIPGALYLLTGIGSLDPLLYLSVVTALLLILSAVLSLWVKKTGSCIFASL